MKFDKVPPKILALLAWPSLLNTRVWVRSYTVQPVMREGKVREIHHGDAVDPRHRNLTGPDGICVYVDVEYSGGSKVRTPYGLHELESIELEGRAAEDLAELLACADQVAEASADVADGEDVDDETPVEDLPDISAGLVDMVGRRLTTRARLLEGAWHELVATGRPGSACAALTKAREQEQLQRAAAALPRWWMQHGQACRLDGLEIALADQRHVHNLREFYELDRLPTDGPVWEVNGGPPTPGAMSRPELVDAPSLLEAIELVDARWPMAPWWSTFGLKRRELGRVAATAEPVEDPEASAEIGDQVAQRDPST